MKIALGPNLYYWDKETTFNFYQQVAHWPVDTVYLGETVCARRYLMRLNDWLEIAQMLQAAGKEVVLSSLGLIESEADAQSIQRLLDHSALLIEANDMGAVQMLNGRPFVAGAGLNIYNTQTLEFLTQLGAKRWVMPVEMNKETLSAILQQKPQHIETEVFAFGRLPLAISARCFTARHYNLPKDDCQFKCLAHPTGIPLHTREGQKFLTLNGVQTQSAKVYHLLAEIDSLKQMGINTVRISPQPLHTKEVLDLFWQRHHQTLDSASALTQLDAYLIDEPCNGYWHGKTGMEQHTMRPIIHEQAF